MSVRVVIDIRETDLWRELEPFRKCEGEECTEGWYVEQQIMDVGDIGFFISTDKDNQASIILERKTAEDLGASQKDGRYREQRARLYALRGKGTTIGYIVEAPAWSPTLSRTWCRGAFNEVNLQQAIVRLQFRYAIPVLQATSIKETIQWIRRIAKALVADPNVYKGGQAKTVEDASACYTEAIHVKKSENKTPERVLYSMLLTIPGLGKTAVDSLLIAAEQSLIKLQLKTEKELSEIQNGKRKLGKSLAAVIYAALHS